MTTTKDTDREQFFYKDLEEIPEPISKILSEYSGISKDKQKEHILNVRDRAYQSHPYPCLGRFRFLELDLSSYPLYETYVLPSLRKGSQGDAIFLDLGTCLGQDIRKLIYDGADPTRLYGSDIVSDYIDSGYELFRDEAKLSRDNFICPADLFDTSKENTLRRLYDKVDILHATAVFHLFAGEQQAEVARQCLRLVKKESGSRTLVLGGQAGNVDAQESVRGDGTKMYRHNGDSWEKLWQEIRGESEFRDKVKSVNVEVRMEDWTRWKSNQGDSTIRQKFIGQIENGFRWMVWQVWVQC